MRLNAKGIRPAVDSVTFTFDGRQVVAQEGDSIAAALVDQHILGLREAEDGSRRGVFCGMGVCGECAVQSEDGEIHLSCMTEVEQGAVLKPAPARRELQDVTVEEPEQQVTCDVLIVGSGPAGLAVATDCALAGLVVHVIDERATAGGQYYKQPAEGRVASESDLDRQFRSGRAAVAAAERAGVVFHLGVRVWAAFSRDQVMAQGAGQRWRFVPQHLVVATGAFERALPAPGWTLPGVMTSGAAQTLIRRYQVAPGRAVIVAGNGPLNLQVAADLARAGVTVRALVESARPFRHPFEMLAMALLQPTIALQGLGYMLTLRRHGVPTIPGSAIVAMHGDDCVRSVEVSALDRAGNPQARRSRAFEVEAVALGPGFSSSSELLRHLGCRHDVQHGQPAAVRDGAGRTSVDGVWTVGDAAQVLGSHVAALQGRITAAAICSEFGRGTAGPVLRVRLALLRHRAFQWLLRRVYQAPTLRLQLATAETHVCRCQAVSLGALMDAIDAVPHTAGGVKRMTRAGMGACQGRYCAPLIADAIGAPADERFGFAPQAPYKPTTIGTMAEPVER